MKTLTVFAGPNGSGKTTITDRFREAPPFALGHYLNPDDIELALSGGFIELRPYTLTPSESDWGAFLRNSTLADKICQDNQITKNQLANDLFLNERNSLISLAKNNSLSTAYVAALVTDFIRQMLIEAGQSFTFETVMSSADKIDTIRRSREAGYFIRLFYVTTRDPDINVSRVKNRVQKGGHPVPADKIRERYWRSLANLADALRLADEAYLYDNSTDGSQSLEVARLQDGLLTVTAEFVPDWYIRYVEEKFV